MEPVVVLFDLDGTVLDTEALILGSWRHVRDTFGLDATDDVFRAGMGRPLHEVLAPFVAPGRTADQLVEVYRAHNHAHHDELARPFPGIPEVFDALRAEGVKLGIVTSKLRWLAARGLEINHLVVDVLVGPADAARPKPHPDPVWLALQLLGAEPAHAVMVGDSPHDIEAGRAAGVSTAAVSWGMFPAETLRAAAPDRWLDRVDQLAGLGRERHSGARTTSTVTMSPRSTPT